MSDQLTGQTIGLLQTLIRNECVNDGTAESGHEVRSVDVLKSYLAGTGLAMEQFEPTPGRASLVARIEGTTQAPRVLSHGPHRCRPRESGWLESGSLGGELVDGEVWGGVRSTCSI